MSNSSTGPCGRSGWRPRPSASYAATFAPGARTMGWKSIVTAPVSSSSRIARPPRGEVPAERRLAHVRAVVVDLRLHVASEAELVVADVQDVALVQGRVGHLAVVHERAVAAAEVAHAQREAVGVDLGVDLRDEARRQQQRARPWCGRSGTGGAGSACAAGRRRRRRGSRAPSCRWRPRPARWRRPPRRGRPRRRSGHRGPAARTARCPAADDRTGLLRSFVHRPASMQAAGRAARR